jgi:hypothetical protein
MINEPLDETSNASSTTSSNTSAPAGGRTSAPTEQRIPVTHAEREAIERVSLIQDSIQMHNFKVK